MQFPLKLTAQFLKRSYAQRMFRGWWKIAIAAVIAAVVVIPDAMRGSLGITSVFVLSAMGFLFRYRGLRMVSAVEITR